MHITCSQRLFREVNESVVGSIVYLATQSAGDTHILKYVGETQRGVDRFKEHHDGMERALAAGANKLWFTPVSGVLRRRALETVIRYEYCPTCNDQVRPTTYEYERAKFTLTRASFAPPFRSSVRPTTNALMGILPNGSVPKTDPRSQVGNALLSQRRHAPGMNIMATGLLGSSPESQDCTISEIVQLLLRQTSG